MRRLIAAVPVLALALAPVAASAQQSAGGGLGGLLGGGLPSVAGVGAGNAAGLIGYCLKNRLLSGENASSVLGKLTGQQGVAASPGFAAGQKGMVQSGNRAFSLNSVGDTVKARLCDAVLDRGMAFLPR